MVFIVEPRGGIEDRDGGSPCLNVALVNNMPDAALAQTERQFAALLAAGRLGANVRLRYFTLPGVPRGNAAAKHIRDHYLPLEQLWHSPVDALIVTGCEPKAARVSDEPYWAELREVLEWGCRNTASVVASCLAAHAAVLAFDGIDRCRLTTKLSGVFEQGVDTGHVLAAGIDSRVRMPHSRLNDVPLRTIAAHGYRPVISSDAIGWTVATKQIGPSLLVLMQGHPEYEPETLLLEFRRDLRRYLNRERETYPQVPAGYLSREAESAFETVREHSMAADLEPDPAMLARLPFDWALSRLNCPWRGPSRRLYANWLSLIAASASMPEVAHA